LRKFLRSGWFWLVVGAGLCTLVFYACGREGNRQRVQCEAHGGVLVQRLNGYVCEAKR
jgi:hypothetical protein